MIEKYCYNGVFFVNDIVSEDKQVLLHQEFQNRCMIRTHFIEYYDIVNAATKACNTTYFRVLENT